MAIDGSARSIDPSLTQPSIDRASIDRWRCSIDRCSCTIDYPWPSIDACTQMIELKLND